ncbi:MAG: polyketide cyclase [Alphaproteobacteria bacterium]|nr:polyketide cyclase [Alphaproteobacteria bacterium]
MTFNPETDLEISRFLAAPRAKLWRAWSDPNNLKEWWCPKPWVTEVKAFEFYPGGSFHTYMTGPDGQGGTGESDNPGCFLEIVPQERIVGTSAMVGGWRPVVSWMPMTSIHSFKDEAGGTRYRAHVIHMTSDARQQHLDMGFEHGWGLMISQLEEFAKALKD